LLHLTRKAGGKVRTFGGEFHGKGHAGWNSALAAVCLGQQLENL
jgi:hypothetical protein